jgi:MYXO-CTERM domain-containing protein
VDSLKFGASASALTSTQLASLRFSDYSNAAGQIDSFGVVTPVAIPEPASWALGAGAGALGLAFWVRRRRSHGVG